MRDLERERAADALSKVKALENRSDRFKGHYRSYVDRLGGAVVMNGLGQALATELAAAGPLPHRDPSTTEVPTPEKDTAAAEGSAAADKKEAHKALFTNVGNWLCRPGGVYPGASDVLEAIVSDDQTHYVRAQVETLAWLTWHKKFCHAGLRKGAVE